MAVFQSMDHSTPEEDLEELARLAGVAAVTLGNSGAVGHDHAVEVGSWMGGTSLVLLDRFERVYCVDTWTGNPDDRLGEIARRHDPYDLVATFCGNMGSKLFDSVFPLPGTSFFWASVWPRPVALVFIDADHEYVHVKNDVLSWRRHVLPGGVLCGHDYGVFPGVTRAVDELIPEDQLTVKGTVWSTRMI